MALTIYLLTMPGSDIPQENWMDKLYVDKWVHIGLFAVLVWLWCWAMPVRTRKIFYIVCIAGILYGVGMEFVQKYWTSDRSFDMTDMIADAVGAGAGLVFSLWRYIKK